MSVQAWEPQGAVIEEAFLRRCIRLSEEGRLNSLAACLTPGEKRQRSGLMQLEPAAWQQAAATFSDSEILHLVRFFTVAEMQLPGWQAGPKSPVIGLAKALRSRGQKLEREILLWIKENSDNRYLPYGPVL